MRALVVLVAGLAVLLLSASAAFATPSRAVDGHNRAEERGAIRYWINRHRADTGSLVFARTAISVARP